MTPKDMEKISNNLLFKDENGNIISFNQIEVVNIGDMDNQKMIEASPIDDMELELNLKDITPADGLTHDDLFLILFCGCDIEKVKQNNWRKMHGIPMRRKIK
nr:hypothetical protein [uncultured Blautia sp.]